MNTVKSFWVGWGSLIVAGGGAYYFAKQQINADRREKHLRRLQQQQYNDNSYLEHDNAGSPARETAGDPAATRHEPQTEEQALSEKGKYEARITYQSRRGDRFS
ncbi:uncharacterized protein H6S33_000268 [Morchella sextelata]|uniref:uncharacterized protein n=1 Tax=Morchella sextelata TaxID=1174677 RepID=UPI001D045C41|nr:uncharacterized protein H6S33_000268 [Morchella sextelata]KAH0614632.1 hypothetical protein H6S33_000268 [Morchella sextelata]